MGTFGIEQGGFQGGLPVECNRDIFRVAHGSNGTGWSSVWISFEWSREVFSLGYSSNGTVSSSVFVPG